jgi:hypothetical protein
LKFVLLRAQDTGVHTRGRKPKYSLYVNGTCTCTNILLEQESEAVTKGRGAYTHTKKFAWLSIMQNGSVLTDPGKVLMNLLENGTGTGQGKSVGVVLVGEACKHVFHGDIWVGVVEAGAIWVVELTKDGEIPA